MSLEVPCSKPLLKSPLPQPLEQAAACHEHFRKLWEMGRLSKAVESS